MGYFLRAIILALSVARVQADVVAVTGVQSGIQGAGPRPARLNIYTLQQSGPAWDLYIQGLTAMKAAAENATTGFFQIAGIHGRPYESWDGVSGVSLSSTNWYGYCPHDSILFPTWHRPYLALFEQSLSSYVQAIAAKYNGSSASVYSAAAASFRIPFWDWGSSPAMPAILNAVNLTINTPLGRRSVANPLYSYTLPPLNPTYFPTTDPNDGALALEPVTLRDPNAIGISQPDLVNQALQNQQFKALTYRLFSSITDYPTFATQINSGSSLEAVHGLVHTLVGGNSKGDMYQLSYAAFDPIFWLHHANVDRLFSLWQAIYADSWIPTTGNSNPYGTFTISANSIDYSSTSLKPFRGSDGTTFYTSDTARSLSTFCYTYPEIDDWNQTPAQLAANVTAQVNALYSPSTTTSTSRIRRTSTSASASTREWTIAISVDKFALQSSFSVKIFLGAPPADASTWSRASNLAGFVAVMLPTDNASVSAADAAVLTHGEVLLDSFLTQAQLSLADDTAVLSYLKQNLQWRVQKADGTVVDTASVHSLQLVVQDEEVTPAPDATSFPTRGPPTLHPELTQ